MIPASLKKKLTLLSFRFAKSASKRLGYENVSALMSFLGHLQMKFNRRRREAVKKNFRLIRGDEEGWENTFKYFWSTIADTLVLPYVSKEWIEDKILLIFGLEHLIAYKGKGLIITTAHLGNPELMANAAGVVGFEGVAVAEVPSGEWFKEFLKVRERFGTKIIPAGKAYPKLVEALKEGKFVYLVSDRNVSRQRGRVVKLGCGYREIPIGFAKLSIETGTPLAFAYNVPIGGRYYIEVSRPYMPKSIDDAVKWYISHLYRALYRWTDRWFVFWDDWMDRPENFS